jgi:hypothetical protein
LALDQLIEQHGDSIALIRYQMGTTNPFFLYDSLENRARITYYGVGGSGHLYIDGVVDALYNPANWDSLFDTRLNIPSPMEIAFSGNFIPISNQVNLHVRVIATDSIAWSDLHLQCVLVENHIHYNAPNGLTIHNQIMRDMIPDAQGEAFSISEGDTLFFDRTFNIELGIIPDSSEIVVFVQAQQSKNILQAEAMTIPEFRELSVGDEPRPLPLTSGLYACWPNPFNASTMIEYNLDRRSDVLIDIYNLLGERVATIRHGFRQAGVHSVVWDASAFPSGTYFARLVECGQSTSLKMILIK